METQAGSDYIDPRAPGQPWPPGLLEAAVRLIIWTAERKARQQAQAAAGPGGD